MTDTHTKAEADNGQELIREAIELLREAGVGIALIPKLDALASQPQARASGASTSVPSVGGSIDTPEFRELLFCFAREAMSTETVIDNIHAWHRAQLARKAQAAPADGVRDAALEEAARACEKIADARFSECGIRESDTGATYYSGRRAEELETRDEEDADCARAIRALRSQQSSNSATPTDAGGQQ